MNFFLKRWLSDSSNPARVPARPRKLGVENLEDRVTPAITIPDVPVAMGPVQVSGTSAVAAGYDPQTVINPLDPNQVVTVYSTGTGLGLITSANRGQTWSLPVPTGILIRENPLDFDGNNALRPFTVLDSAAAAFDTANNLHVAYIQRNPANTAGVVVAETFAVTGGGAVVNLNRSQVLYRWAGQDPVFNLAVGANNDVAAYTDPDTLQTQANPNAGRGVFVAWNTNATQAGGGFAQLTAQAAVFAAVSDNGGVSYSSPQRVSDGGYFGNAAIDPKIFFTGSRTAGPNGGALGFTFNSAVGLVTDVRDPFFGRNPIDPLTVQHTEIFTGFGFINGANPAVDPNPASSRQTNLTRTVNITDATFSTLADMEVDLSVFGPDIGRLQIDLIAPNGLGTVTLLQNRQRLDGAGATVAGFANPDGTTPGVPTNTSVIGGVAYRNAGNSDGVARSFGLVFDDQAARRVNDPANVSPYIIRVRPEDFFGSLSRYNGATAADLNGTWTLRITNHRLDGTAGIPDSLLGRWQMKFVSRVDTTGFGTDNLTFVSTATTTAGPVGTPTVASPAVGVQGWYSVAVDKTKGSFSPFQGRVYAAFTGGGGNDTDIFVSSSSDNGANWSFPVQVNDDTGSDGFSQGDRAQFQPTVAVDPTTGTVVVMWYDARWDASNGRPATFIATSVDGGNTFSPNTFLNATKSAIDAIDRTTVAIEPVPNNLAALGATGFGNEQGLVVYGGTVVPVWTGNFNDGAGGLLSAVTRIAAGPRVLQGDMGPITDDFISPGGGATGYNDTFAIDGTRELGAIYVRFDRRIDPTTFTPADVRLLYRGTTSAAAEDISGAVLAVTPLNTNGFGATRFLIRLTPQSRVGTYSYAVGPDVSDRIREVSGIGGTVTAGNRMDQNANGTENEPTDAFANPNPTGGTPFVLPYNTDSLPLIIPGPRLVSSTPQTTLDGAVSFIDVTFDRDMLASSFTPSQVIELRLPTAEIVSSGFVITPNPAGTPAALANRRFRVSFPTQTLSGYYSLVLGSGIKSATGIAMDPNTNAGLDLVTGRVTNPAVAGTVSVEVNPGFIGNPIPVAANASTPSVTTSTLTITDPFVITQLLTTPIQLRLDIAFSDVRDLSARLIAPDGTAIQLFTNVGQFGVSSFANFTNTVFNDFAPAGNLIQNGAAPFSNGPFLAQQQLSVLNGKTAGGAFTLEVTNRSTTRSGTINTWGLSLPRAILGSGLGEPVADRTTVGFRIFTASPTQVVSSTSWTPLGPTESVAREFGETSVGVVTASAVDPSDPSGNTVYVGSAYGGLWKTTNFLTADAVGPTWIPLTDNASANALHISTITIVPTNNDATQQSIIYIGTGDADTRLPGVGFLRSTDGGRTFRLLDSSSNADAATNIYPIDSPLRDHLFSSNPTYVYKVVVDPVRLTNGEFVVYAALGGSTDTQGLWRSLTSGRSWTRIQAGEATDFVLGPNRSDLDVNGNPFLRTADIAYLAIAGANGGVYFSDQIAIVGAGGLQRKDGGDGKPLFSNGIQPFVVTPPPGTPTSNPERIVLRAVAATANTDPLAARIYQGWLYALVIGGNVPGLYMTKDFGANWTQVQLQTQTFVRDGVLTASSTLTNNETEPYYGSLAPQNSFVSFPDSRYNSLAVDPTDPNVIYLGGIDGVIRVDVSAVSDVHAQVAQDNSKGGVGAQTAGASVGGISPDNPQPDYFNRLRDPNQPFVTGATQLIGTGSLTNPPTFTNTGDNAMASRFNAFLGDRLVRGIETVFDPLTRKTRLIVATERGVYTGVDGANPFPTQGLFANASLVTAIGSAASVSGDRNGNLALTTATQTAIQPSQLAADLAGLYNQRNLDFFTGNPLPPPRQNSLPGMGIYTVADEGYLNPEVGVLKPGHPNYGVDQWRGELNFQPYTVYTGHVQTDPQGSGTIYQYRPPAFASTAGGTVVDGFGRSTDIFLVTLPGQAPIGRTNGLFLAGDSVTAGQWAGVRTAYFAVNPADKNGIAISAPNGGRVFLTTDQGVNWFAVSTPATFNNSQGTALAFGGRDPNLPSANSFIYNGTAEGRVWVTFTGGGFAANSWTDISAGLSGGRILKIVANPRGGTSDAFAVTATGVFYKADARTATPWVNVTGNLFSIVRPVFGETTTTPILTALTAVEVDWRFTVPVLYAAGNTGVFRATAGTTTAGPTWALFPDMAGGAAVDGGYLPSAAVTDLDLVYGSLNASGVPDQTTGRNVLVATTYGRSLYAIRLPAGILPPGLGTSGPYVSFDVLALPDTNPATPPDVATGLHTYTLTFGDPFNPVVANRVFQQVDITTLTASNVAIVGPGGVQVPFTVTDISSPSTPGGAESARNRFRFFFTPPTSGTYTFLLNTNVRDTSGRRLNQNRDGANGQIPSDWFRATYTITVNQAPTITGVPNQGAIVNAATGPLAFTVGDDTTPAGGLVVTATSSNTVVLPVANIVLGGTGAARTVTVTPVAAGAANVTLTVTDADGRQTVTTFTVSAAVAPAVPFSDTFDRPDALNLGGNWVIQTGTAEGSLNSALGTSPTAAIATLNGVSQLNSVAQATVTLASTGGSSIALVARYAGAGAAADMYLGMLALENGLVTARILRLTAGIPTELARSAPVPLASAYLLRFEVVFDSLKLFVNGQLAAFRYDTAFGSAGMTGIRLTNGNRLDDFSAADITLTPPAMLPAVPGTTATDTFTQADGSQLSRDWRDRLGNLSVTGNTAVGLAAGTNLSTYNLVQSTANAGAETVVSFTAVNQAAGIVLRYSGTRVTPDQNMYWGALRNLGGGQQQASMWRNLNGTWTQLAVAAPSAGTGGVLRFEANGPSLKLFLDGVQVLSAFDTALTTGGVGLRTNQGGAADDFVAFALGTNATLPFSDPFTATPPRNQLPSEWTERAGSISVATGAAAATGTSLATLNGVTASDVVVSATVPTPSGALAGLGLVARYQTGTGVNMYWGALNVFSPTQYMAVIWKYVNGVATPVNLNTAVVSAASAANGVLRFEVLGSSLRLYLNDVLVSFGFDTTYTTGTVGIQLADRAVVDDFAAVTRNATTPTVPGFTDAFPANPPRNTLSTDWQERSGAYSVAADRATGLSTSQPNVAVLNGNAALTNGTVAADFFFTAAGQSAQVVGRYVGTNGTGDSNYYSAAINTLANGDALVRILRNVNGGLSVLATTTLSGYFNVADFTAANPAVELRMFGNQLEMWVDGIQQLTTTDGTFAAGSVGIRTSVNVAIDNFVTS